LASAISAEGVLDYANTELAAKETQTHLEEFGSEHQDWNSHEAKMMEVGQPMVSKGLGDLDAKEFLEACYLQVTPDTVDGYDGPDFKKIWRKAVLSEKRPSNVSSRFELRYPGRSQQSACRYQGSLER
jgi:hypothetical protein